MTFAGLPGAELVEAGLRDLEAGHATVESLLVAIGAPRLRRAGVAVPPVVDQPEHRLYSMLAAEYGDAAHSQYNALIGRLVSFERALEQAGSAAAR